MTLDPLPFFQAYFQQEAEPAKSPSPGPLTESAAGDFSIDALVSNRRKILEVKLAVFLAAARKRFEIRESNLASLLEDELTVGNVMLASPRYVVIDDRRYPITQTNEEQRLLDLERQRREEEASCWRDIIPVMRDILTTWEALEQTRARAIFLSSYPSNPSSEKGGEQRE